MDCKVAFQTYEDAYTEMDYQTDEFVPEMSLGIKEILAQFAYVDNMRLVDLMKQGYTAPDDDDDFDLPDFDSLDIAQKQEYYEHSKEFIKKFEDEQARLKASQEQLKE